MSNLERDVITMIEKNIEYIQLGLSKNHGDYNKAQWLYHLLKSYTDHVDGEHRAKAISERNRLNGKGYSGKAGH